MPLVISRPIRANWAIELSMFKELTVSNLARIQGLLSSLILIKENVQSIGRFHDYRLCSIASILHNGA